MINLNSYDNAIEKIDKTRTWVIPKYKTLYSREIKYKPFTLLLKRYEKDQRDYVYFVATVASKVNNKYVSNTTVDAYGRLKVDLSSIWNDTALVNIEKETNINIYHVEGDNESDIYLLDI